MGETAIVRRNKFGTLISIHVFVLESKHFLEKKKRICLNMFDADFDGSELSMEGNVKSISTS